MKKKNNIINTVLLVVGIIILINILSIRFFFRLDFTEDKIYTLDNSTKQILKNLDEPVTVTAYFTKKLPPFAKRIKDEFMNKLDEFVNVSKGKVEYEFINPEDEETKKEARSNGIREVPVGKQTEDEVSSKLAFLGAVVKMGTDQEVLPLISSEIGMEYSLAKAIKKLSIKNKPVVGLLQGHGEAGMQQIQHVYHELSAFYDVQTVYLNDSTENLKNINSLMIVAPTDSFPQTHLNQISAFIEKGNNLLVALNTVTMDESMQYGQKVGTNFNNLLEQYGISVNSDYVVDALAPSEILQMQAGPGQIQMIPVKFFYFPTIIDFSDNPVVGGIEEITFRGLISSISYNGTDSGAYTPILKTSEKSGTKGNYYLQELMRNWTEADFPLSEITVGATLEKKLDNGMKSRMVIFGDGDFPLGDQRNPQIPPDNLNLFVNAVDWLSDDTGLVGLRTKGATSRPIEEMEESKSKTLKVINLAIPLLLIITIGIARRINNNKLQNKRREEGYV